jgi:hypothetical protein
MSVAESVPGPEPRRAKRAARRGPPCRRFTLLDGMILVGVAAVGFAGYRAGLDLYSDWPLRVRMYVEAFLLLASWLVLIFRFRRPRPSIRLMTRQPGAVACFAVVAVQVVQGCDSLVTDLAGGNSISISGVGSAIWFFLSDLFFVPAAVVLISWALLVAGRRWRPEPGWIDSLGRWVGWAWIVWLVAWPVIYFVIRDGGSNAPGFRL